jgi:hypothetical protein
MARMHRSYMAGMWTQIGVATFNVILSVAFRRTFTWIDSFCLSFSTCFAALMWSWAKQTKMRELMVDLSLIEAKMHRNMAETYLTTLEARLPENED